MDHPFHLHGFFFQVIEEQGKAPAYRAWKDTVNLPPRSKMKIAWMPDNRPGTWMYHCHIIEHHAAGMMAHFEVIDGAERSIKSLNKNGIMILSAAGMPEMLQGLWISMTSNKKVMTGVISHKATDIIFLIIGEQGRIVLRTSSIVSQSYEMSE